MQFVDDLATRNPQGESAPGKPPLRVFVPSKVGCLAELAMMLAIFGAAASTARLIRSAHYGWALIPLAIVTAIFLLERARKKRHGTTLPFRIDHERFRYVSSPDDQRAYDVFRLAIAAWLIPGVRWAWLGYASVPIALLACVLSIVGLSRRQPGRGLFIASLVMSAIVLVLFISGVVVGLITVSQG